MSGDWRTDLETARLARLPPTEAQARWDCQFDGALAEGKARGLAPGPAGLRAMNVTEMRHGPRPTTKETETDA